MNWPGKTFNIEVHGRFIKKKNTWKVKYQTLFYSEIYIYINIIFFN